MEWIGSDLGREGSSSVEDGFDRAVGECRLEPHGGGEANRKLRVVVPERPGRAEDQPEQAVVGGAGEWIEDPVESRSAETLQPLVDVLVEPLDR